MQDVDVAVVGGGLAGQTAALALARAGRKVLALVPEPPVPDRRTTALMDPSIRFMDRLGVWEEIRQNAAALSTIQILDGTRRLLRAPPVAFHAEEVGLDAFGYNVANATLLPVLAKALEREPNVTLRRETAESLSILPERVELRLSSGDVVSAAFVVGADGRRSRVRESAGIGTRLWFYPQSALVLNFGHALPHRNVSTEFHTETGPFTQVPLPNNRSSLVWVMKPEEAEATRVLPPDVLGREVEVRMQSLLGKVTVEDGAQVWPLSGMMAHRFGMGRVALIGEAGHVFPPIGAQGLNLGLRDIMALTEIVAQPGDRPISADAGDRFDRRRQLDVGSRTAGVDLLNRSLLSDFLPVQVLRVAGLHLLKTLPPLRGLVMREGVEPGRGFRALPSFLSGKPSRESV